MANVINNTYNDTELNNFTIIKSSAETFYIWLYIILFSISALIGVVGNSFIVIVIFAYKTLRDIKNAFIFNLAIADLTVAGVTMPMSIIGILAGRVWFDKNKALCQFSALVCAPGCVASTYSICMIAVSRYFYVCKYSSYLKYFNKFRVTVYILVVWLVSFSAHVPNHIGWGMIRYSSQFKFCTFDSDHYTYSLYYASFLICAIVITAVFYGKIYVIIKDTNLPRQLMVGGGKKGVQRNGLNAKSFLDELRLVRASFKIFVVFLIFWAPATLLILLSLGERVPEWVYLYSALAAHSNSTLNVFIYYFENHAFRRAIKTLLCGRRFAGPLSYEMTFSKNSSKIGYHKEMLKVNNSHCQSKSHIKYIPRLE